MIVHEDINLLDFGMGMLAGLRRAGLEELSERRLYDVHAAWVEAFKVVEAEIPREHLQFWMTTDEMHHTSQDVDHIFRYWVKGPYVTKDAPGVIYRFHFEVSSADDLLKKLAGGAELYDKATAAFTDYLDTHYSTY